MAINADWLKEQYKPLGTLIPIGIDKRPFTPNWQNIPDFHSSMFSERCGLRPHAGVIILDVDVKGEHNGFQSLELIGLDSIDTLAQDTPSGGRHYFFTIDPSIEIKNAVGFMGGLDVRVAGKGQVVCFPTQDYNWLDWDIGNEPMPELAPIPQELLMMLVRHQASKPEVPAVSSAGKLRVGVGGRNNYLTSYAGRIHNAGAPYDALKIAVLAENSRLEFPLDDDEALAIVKSVTRYSRPDAAAEFEHVEHGRSIVGNLLKTRQEQLAQELSHSNVATTATIEQPHSVIPQRGLLREMVDHIVDTSVRQQPLLALMASIALVGALAGRKYRSPTDLRTNVYMIGLAQTGHGKDHARKIIGSWAYRAGCDEIIGGEKFASGQAMISALVKTPSRVFMIDEFGLVLQASTIKTAASHQKEVVTNLLSLYSTSNSIYRGTEYANQKDRPTEIIVNPNLCIYGTSTHSTFFDALKASDVSSGTVPRLIVVETNTKRPPRQHDPQIGRNDDHIIAGIKRIYEFTGTSGGNLAGINSGKVMPNPMMVPMMSDVKKAINDLDDSFDNGVMTDDLTNAVYTRVAENITKLAMIYAISIDYLNPIIDMEAYEWARDLVLWSSNLIVNRARENLSENQHESNLKRILVIIKQNKGITKTALAQKSQWLKSKERAEILEDLKLSDQIEERLDATTTKPITRYFYKKES
jgi:hypothetical protein